MAIVVGPKALEESHDHVARLGCPIGELVPSPVVLPYRDEHTLVDIKGRDQPLCEDVYNVIVTVRAIVN